MYFLFLVKTKTVFNPKTLCAPRWRSLEGRCAGALRRSLTLDPDPQVYPSYFSADASGLVYGTSPKTVQLAKPINDKDARYLFPQPAYHRGQVPDSATMPTGVQAPSRRRSASGPDNRDRGDENPLLDDRPTIHAGKPMFISWGFNMYPDSLWKTATSNPLAYRWAKNHLNYDEAEEKPPGWRTKDSTHFDPDPLQGWMGTRSDPFNVEPRICRTLDQPFGI